MAIIIKRRDNESSERVIRRFVRRIQTSGLLIRTKKGLFFLKDKNKNQTKKKALHRLALRQKEDYLRKIGELEEDPRQRGGNRRSNKR